MNAGGGLLLIVLGGLLLWMAATGKLGPCAACFRTCLGSAQGTATSGNGGVSSIFGASPSQLISPIVTFPRPVGA